jgi:hypothetical protein
MYICKKIRKMEGKLRQLMKHEGINSTRLAEMLGIQASGISHIMSGRNKPSFDFLLKLLQRFPQLNPDWLILDKGPMYRGEIKAKNGAGSSVGAGARSEGSIAAGGSGLFGVAGEQSSAIGGISRADGSSVGLFEPDNSDIIPTSGASGGAGYQVNSVNIGNQGGPVAGARLEEYGTARQMGNIGQMVATTLPPDGSYPPGQAGYEGATAQPTAERPVQQLPAYQSGSLIRSASIERIVVFYKDKTFSEYQPE